MDGEERTLRDAVKNARSAFYKNKVKHKKQSRKETRKTKRLDKKAKHHAFLSNKHAEPIEVQPVEKKKRKRKRKKKTAKNENSAGAEVLHTDCSRENLIVTFFRKKGTSQDVDVKNQPTIEETEKDEEEDFDYTRYAYEAANKKDDQIIASLGKKLKANKKSADDHKLFKEDGLDYILEVCDPLTDAYNNNDDDSDQEYLAAKKNKKQKLEKKTNKSDITEEVEDISNKLLFDDKIPTSKKQPAKKKTEIVEDEFFDEDNEILAAGELSDDDEDYDDDDFDNDENDDDDSEIDFSMDQTNESDSADDNDVKNKETADSNDDNEKQDKGDTTSDVIKGKYVPPALRKMKESDEDKEHIKKERLKKQLKGLLNRLSGSTLHYVTTELETIYSSNSRNTVNELLYELIYDALIIDSLMAERFVMEYVVMISTLHSITGSEIGMIKICIEQLVQSKIEVLFVTFSRKKVLHKTLTSKIRKKGTSQDVDVKNQVQNVNKNNEEQNNEEQNNEEQPIETRWYFSRLFSNTADICLGSYTLQMFVEKFDELHQEEQTIYGNGKQCQNLIIVICYFYLLKIVDCLLIIDIVRRLVKQFNEQDIEMVLFILRVCGTEIRKDDPGALKEIILDIQAKSTTSNLQDQSRVRFMLDMITALKNNNMRKIQNHDPTIMEDGRKFMKALLKGRDVTSSVQLKVSLEDLLNAKEKVGVCGVLQEKGARHWRRSSGKWWVVGSAWAGRGPAVNRPTDDNTSSSTNETKDVRLLEAAKKQRMNTNLRKDIFCAMMTSQDYMDAFEKLLKLNLKEKQSREVIHVLLDCCLQEKSYNPFYAHLADKFCEYAHSHKVTLQYSLWDRFKSLSTLQKHHSINLASFLAHIIASKSISLAVLKVISFGVLDKASIHFFVRLFKILLVQYPESVARSAFERISSQEKLSPLRDGLKVFLRHFLTPKKTDDPKHKLQNDKIIELIEKAELALDGREYIPL